MKGRESVTERERQRNAGSREGLLGEDVDNGNARGCKCGDISKQNVQSVSERRWGGDGRELNGFGLRSAARCLNQRFFFSQQNGTRPTEGCIVARIALDATYRVAWLSPSVKLMAKEEAASAERHSLPSKQVALDEKRICTVIGFQMLLQKFFHTGIVFAHRAFTVKRGMIEFLWQLCNLEFEFVQVVHSIYLGIWGFNWWSTLLLLALLERI